MRKNIKNLLEVGKQYGYYILLSKEGIVDNMGHLKVPCKCVCGKENYIFAYRLLNPKYKIGSCKSCSNKRNPKWKGTGVGEITGTLFHHIKKNAIARNLEFNINKQQVWELFLKQNRKCKFSGIELTFAKNINRTPDYNNITASLDRIDSSKGYTIDNVQWVHKTINIMKSNMSDEDFISICKLISNNYDNFEPSCPLKKTEGATTNS